MLCSASDDAELLFGPVRTQEVLVVIEQLLQRCCELRVQLVYLLLRWAVALLHCRKHDTSQHQHSSHGRKPCPRSTAADGLARPTHLSEQSTLQASRGPGAKSYPLSLGFMPEPGLRISLGLIQSSASSALAV